MASAIIKTGGKQYRVEPGQVIAVETLNSTPGSKITFAEVLLVNNGSTVTVGAPFVTNITVTGEVIEEFKGEKVRVFTYKSKKRQRRTLGHRQLLTKVKITQIGSTSEAEAEKPGANTEKAPKASKAKAVKA